MAKTHPPYPSAFRAEAVELARTSGKGIPQLAQDLGVAEQALRGWLKRTDIDAGRGQRGALTSAEREALRRLRREHQVLRPERAILRKAAAVFAQETRCAASGSSRRSRPPTPRRSRAGCSASRAPATTPGRAAGSRRAPLRIGRSPPRSRRSTSKVDTPTAHRASRPP